MSRARDHYYAAHILMHMYARKGDLTASLGHINAPLRSCTSLYTSKSLCTGEKIRSVFSDKTSAARNGKMIISRSNCHPHSKAETLTLLKQ